MMQSLTAQKQALKAMNELQEKVGSLLLKEDNTGKQARKEQFERMNRKQRRKVLAEYRRSKNKCQATP